MQDRSFQGGCVTEIIRTFSFAPQRFESFYTPLMNLLLVIPAIVKMLKMIAEDWRDPKQAQRAMRALSAFDGQFILVLGLIADYGAVCLRLLPRFDARSKDPSVTRRLLRQWEEQLISLFCEANIFRAAPRTAARADERDPTTSRPPRPKTAAQIAMEQMIYIGEVDYLGHIHDFLAVSPKELFARGMREMHEVIKAARARMAAEFVEAELYKSLEIFNPDEWMPLLPLASSQSLLSNLHKYRCLLLLWHLVRSLCF